MGCMVPKQSRNNGSQSSFITGILPAGGKTTGQGQPFVKPKLVSVVSTDNGLCEDIKESRMAWLYVGILRQWQQEDDRPLPRRQDLTFGEFAEGAEVAAIWHARRDRLFVISHGWLATRHPDPWRTQIQELVEELAVLRAADTDLIFYDYCSLPQDGDPGRTDRERQEFKTALRCMSRLYTCRRCEVLILPQVPPVSEIGAPYIKRGWCYFELSISVDSRTIVNRANPAVEALCCHTPSTPDVLLEAFRDNTVRFSDMDDVEHLALMYRELWNESPQRAKLWREVGAEDMYRHLLSRKHGDAFVANPRN